jgi:hypothetical protein
MTVMPEPAPRRPARATRALVVLVATLLALPLGASQAQTDEAEIPGKTFAAYEFGWYPIHFVDHFVDPLGEAWEVEGPGSVQTQNGMITIESAGDETTGVTLRGEAHATGRWEIRLRARRYEATHTDFTVAAELVPAGNQAYDCGARNIGFASFRPTGHRARFHIRNLPDQSFGRQLRAMNLRNDYWHTYGVEVTPDRISWFVDGAVQATERRPEALSGIPMAFRLQLQAVPGATMNESRLQVDTVRYFTLQNPNDLPVQAPRPVAGTYDAACPASEEPAARTR